VRPESPNGGREDGMPPRHAAGLTGRYARQVATLSTLRDLLNAETGDVADEIRALVQGTIVARIPSPMIPPNVWPRYRTLGRRYPFVYTTIPAMDGTSLPSMRAVDPAMARDTLQVVELEAYFRNRARHRLRQCAHCSSWFLDVTRNGSALRCSLRCTRKWWHAHR